MSRLEKLDGANWAELVASPAAVIVIGKSDCAACNAWSAELETLLSKGERFPHVRFGKLLLDQPGLVSFKRANPWISELDVLPFNVIYRGGERVGDFAGSGAERLEARVLRLLAPAGGEGA